jgi:O-antigen/teichoic acid export membrane protein
MSSGGPVANLFLSRVGLLQAQGGWQELTQQRSSWRRLLTLGTLSVAIPIAFLGHRFLGLWISPEMALKGGPILIALSAGWAISAVGSLDAVTLEGLGRPDLAAKALVIWGLIAAAIVAAVGKPLGAVTVAIGVATWLSGVGLTNMFVCQRLLREREAPSGGVALLAGIVGVILTGATCAWLVSDFATTLLRCITGMASVAIVTGCAGLWAILKRDERALLAGRVQSVFTFAGDRVRRKND